MVLTGGMGTLAIRPERLESGLALTPSGRDGSVCAVGPESVLCLEPEAAVVVSTLCTALCQLLPSLQSFLVLGQEQAAGAGHTE